MPYVDTLVREYLLYRGCSGALAAFDAERGEGQAFDRADRVAELIFGRHVPRLDAVGLSRTLGLLRDRYFSRLDASFAPATAELETSIARLFVVTAAKARRKDKIAELFEAEGERLVAAGGDHELYRWFAVPYVKRPSSDPRFAPYFEDAWADAVVASARNFLSVAFAAAPEPVVLRFGAARRERARLESRVAALEREVALLRGRNNDAGASLDAARTESGDSRVAGDSRNATGEDSEARRRDPKRAFAVGVESAFDSDESAFDSSFELPPRDRHRDKIETRNAVTAVTFTRQDAFSLHAPRPVAHARFAPAALVAGAGDDGARSASGPSTTRRATSPPGISAAKRLEKITTTRRHPYWRRCTWARTPSARWRGTWTLSIGTRVKAPAACCTWARATPPCAPGTWTSAPWSRTRRGMSPSHTARTCGARRAGDGSRGARRRGTRGRAPNPAARAGRRSAAWRCGTRALTCVASLPLGAAAPCAHELAFNHNGKMLAAAGADGEIRLFDVNASRLVAKWRAHPKGHAATSVAFSSSATADARVFGVGTDGVVAEWSLRSLRASLGAVDVRDVCGVDTRTRLALDPEGRGVALTSAVANGAVAVLERRDGNRAAANDGDAAPSKAPSGARGGQAVSLPGNGAAARCVDWHPTRSAVLAGCVDGTSMLTTLEMSASEG